MFHASSRVLASVLASAGLMATAVLGPAAALADEDANGAVYTMTKATNGTNGNASVVFHRSETGALTAAGTVGTRGNGTGTGLGSGHSVVTTDGGRYVIAVNGGSNSVSVSRRHEHSLKLVGSAAPFSRVAPAPPHHRKSSSTTRAVC